MTDPNELRKQSAAFHHESEMSKTLVLEADTIERLTAELGDLPESQADMLREIKQLKAERDALKLDAARWHYFCRYLASDRTDLVDAILACRFIKDFNAVIDTAIAKEKTT